MAEFSIGFAESLAKMATETAKAGLSTPEAGQAVLYVARVSIEISLKALLERAGFQKRQIMNYKHDLRSLLAAVNSCTVEREIHPGLMLRVPAKDLRSITISAVVGETTVGAIVDAEDHGASQYPTHIRYGPVIEDFPPEAVANASSAVVDWAKRHWDDIKAYSTAPP